MKEQIIDGVTTKVLVLSAKQTEKMELDHESDLNDEVCSRLGVQKCKFLFSGWDDSNSNYVVVIKVE